MTASMRKQMAIAIYFGGNDKTEADWKTVSPYFQRHALMRADLALEVLARPNEAMLNEGRACAANNDAPIEEIYSSMIHAALDEDRV